MRLLHRVIVAVPMMLAISAMPAARPSQDTPKTVQSADLSGLHDFDFFVGRWRTHSRRLKERCAGSHDWEQFDGTIHNYKLMNGRANVDDSEFDTPEGIYRGVAPRAYDPQAGLWAIWWIDGRNPLGPVDPPVRGRFVHGVGTFYADDTLRGKPIRVRFVWSQITATTAHWEQSFSCDDGKTWEVNWIQVVHKIK